MLNLLFVGGVFLIEAKKINKFEQQSYFLWKFFRWTRALTFVIFCRISKNLFSRKVCVQLLSNEETKNNTTWKCITLNTHSIELDWIQLVTENEKKKTPRTCFFVVHKTNSTSSIEKWVHLNRASEMWLRLSAHNSGDLYNFRSRIQLHI